MQKIYRQTSYELVHTNIKTSSNGFIYVGKIIGVSEFYENRKGHVRKFGNAVQTDESGTAMRTAGSRCQVGNKSLSSLTACFNLWRITRKIRALHNSEFYDL
jgi:hypothetical protein